MISLVWKQKGAPSNHAIYQGISVLHLLGKLLNLSYLYSLDAETHHHGWLLEEQAGFYLGHYLEDH